LWEVSHESFVFISSTFKFEESLARKLAVIEEGLARKLRFNIANWQISREVSHKMRF